jgi:hypothetical protein
MTETNSGVFATKEEGQHDEACLRGPGRPRGS